MRKQIENAYGNILTSTFKVVNPIKKSIISTDCEVHKFIQINALDILKNEGYYKEYIFFKSYLTQINKGLVWADQDFKCYHHFYNLKEERGKFGYEENALTVANKYYDKAKRFFNLNRFELSLFYFGAACHIVQDLTVPHHAKGKLLDNHRQYELYIKKMYKNTPRLIAKNGIVKLNSVEEYLVYNGRYAIYYDDMYRNISDLRNRFYMLAMKCVPLAQKSSAGFMLMFFKDIFSDKSSY